jgi:hypothetical protein
MSITRIVWLFGVEKSFNQVVFEAVSFGIVDQAGFSASLDIGKGLLQRRRIQPLPLSFLPQTCSAIHATPRTGASGQVRRPVIRPIPAHLPAPHQ